MNIIKLKRLKVGAGISTSDPAIGLSVGKQIESLASIAAAVPKLLVVGLEQPNHSAGVEFVKTDTTPTVKAVIGHFLGRVTGQITCLIAEPTILINKEGVQKLLDHVDYGRGLLAWGSYFDRGFIFSTLTIANIYGSIPEELKFTDDWHSVLKGLGTRQLSHRFVNGESYGITTRLFDPVPAFTPSEEIAPEVKVKAKRGRPKKSATPA